ncbi:hypothetical protein ACFYO2_22630 [Streptomyces sp. NPDC006602]|uniref:barstar family protein n=1 Tax=Streptomyces sp. NPDC006602 TaxID=3364751 RepID=UPI0036A56925
MVVRRHGRPASWSTAPTITPTPLLIVVRNWEPYAKALPEEREIAQEVFSEAAGRTRALTVALALGGSSQGPSDLAG